METRREHGRCWGCHVLLRWQWWDWEEVRQVVGLRLLLARKKLRRLKVLPTNLTLYTGELCQESC